MQAEATIAVGALCWGLRRWWRWWVAPSLAVMVLAAACLEVAGRPRAPAVSGAAADAGGLAAPSRVSADARSVISTTVGAGDARFAPRRSAAGFELSGGGVAMDLRRGGVGVSGGGARLSLGLVGIGRGASLWPVDAVAPRVRSGRVVYARGRGVREWYAAGPLGMEQGFYLARPPAGGAGAVTLALATGGLRARLSGSGVEFLARSGRVKLRYGGLAAFDATGRGLPAWLSLSGSRLLLGVEDRGARYPLRIDPFVQQAKLEPAPNGWFGSSVAVDGNTIAAGAWSTNISSQGAVSVFVRNPNVWTQQQKLVADDGGNGGLGWSVAISGDTIVAGAPFETVGGIPQQGAAYVFVRNGSSWIQQAKLSVGNAFKTGHDFFGYSVAISGDTLIVGAPYSLRGRAYVFERSGGGWRQAAELMPPNGDCGPYGNCEFGYSVAIFPPVVAVGEPGRTSPAGGENAGSIVEGGKVGDKWLIGNPVFADDGAPGDQLGYSVAILGSPGNPLRVAAGAPYATLNGQTDRGAVYFWGIQRADYHAKLTAYYGSPGFFGLSVAASGDTLLVGAPGSDEIHPRGQSQGAAYVSPGDPQEQKLAASDGAAEDGFGWSVAGSGGLVVVDAPLSGSMGEFAGPGAAYVFAASRTVGRAPLPVNVPIHVAPLGHGCTTSPVRLRVTLGGSPSATARNRAVRVRTVVKLDGRRLLVSSRRAFTITIPRTRLRAGANKLLLATTTSGIGTQRIDPDRAWLHAVVIRCRPVRFTG